MRCSLRPESSQEHLPTSIAGVLRLRAIKPLFAIDLRSASLRMTDLLGGLKYSWLDAENTKRSKKSQALGMTKEGAAFPFEIGCEDPRSQKRDLGHPAVFCRRFEELRFGLAWLVGHDAGLQAVDYCLWDQTFDGAA
jgi:hypothetical protein